MTNKGTPTWKLAATVVGLILLTSSTIVALIGTAVQGNGIIAVGVVAGLVGLALMVAGGKVDKK